jgi:ribosomal protein S18 acetylase RimI-like enzyme
MGQDAYGHLPQAVFPGRIHVVRTETAALGALLSLRRHRAVGLDTESRPAFRRGESYPISLIQVATHRHAYLFQVRAGSPFRALKRLVEDPGLTKVVQGAQEESRGLRRDLGIAAQSLVDLPTVAKAAGYRSLNLRALAAEALGIRISKSAQRSDWSRPDLTPQQIAYAAVDAWACLAVYERIDTGGPPEPDRELCVLPATPRDAAEVAALVRELARSTNETSPVDERSVRTFLRRPGCGALLARRSGATLGMVSYTVRPNLYHAADCCLIEELIVSGNARRQGVGRALLEAVTRMARERRCAEISVSTGTDNREALAIYRSAGYTDEAVLLERHFP